MTGRMVRFGVIGVKGFSRRHVDWLERAMAAGHPVKMTAAATIVDDDDAVSYADGLAAKGVKVVKTFDDLLGLRDEVDIVTLPVGIHLHASLASKALRAGYPVYMEKPAAGTVDEVAELAAAEKESGKQLFVGFQTLYQPSTWVLKRRLLDGVVGTLKKIVITVAWPRFMSYYRRNRWAGKVEIDGQKIFDCPMNNSSAHFLNAALFLAGATLRDSAVPVGVRSELYHASPIESADSDFSRFTTREGVEIIFNASHACTDRVEALLDIIGDKGVVNIIDQEERVLAPWVITDARGNSFREGEDFTRAEVFERVAAAFVDPGMEEICTLANAGMHTAANQMAFMAGAIHQIPREAIECIPGEGGDELFAVRGMNTALESIRREGLLPHETGEYSWSREGGVLEGETVERVLSTIIG